MIWVPHITISPIPAPVGMFDVTTATGHPIGGLDVRLPSRGDYLTWLYPGDVRRKFAGLNQLTHALYNDGGGPLPREIPKDLWQIDSRDTAGTVDPGGIDHQKASDLQPVDAASGGSINWGRRITAPASRANRVLNFYVNNWGGDMRARARLSDSSAADALYVLPSTTNFGGGDACFSIDYAAADAGQMLTVEVYCASRRANVYEETIWKAVWMPPPSPPPRARGWAALQLLTGSMGDGRGSL